MSNRSKFANLLAVRFETTKKGGAEILDAVTEVLQTHLKTEGHAVFPGLGRLKIEKRAARRGHNPRTGMSIQIPEREAIKFKAFPSALKE